MDLSALGATSARHAAVPLEQLAGNSHLTQDEKVTEATRQFEAVLLRQILSNARKTIIHSDEESESSVNDVYQDMVTSQMADAISQSGAFGLARSLQVQLRHQTLDSASPSAASPAATPIPPTTPASNSDSRVNHD